MPEITLTPDFYHYFQQKHLTDHDLILLVDDGGGKCSLQGGACSIGTNFSIIDVDEPDADYPILLTNTQGVRLWTSNYDLVFCGTGLKLDYRHGSIAITDNAHMMLDGTVQLVKGADVLAAFQAGVKLSNGGC